MAEHIFTPADEAAWHAANLPGLIAGNRLQERIDALPVRARLEAYRRAGAGEHLPTVVDALEAGQ